MFPAYSAISKKTLFTLISLQSLDFIKFPLPIFKKKYLACLSKNIVAVNEV